MDYYEYSILSYSLVSMLIYNARSYSPWWVILSGTIQYVPILALMPRLILSLRKFHACVQRNGGSGIDTGFGLTSGAIVSGIIFADGGQDESEEEGEAIQMEERAATSIDSSA